MATRRQRMICISISLSILIAIIVIIPTTVVLTKKVDSTTVKTKQETAMATEVTTKPETTMITTVAILTTEMTTRDDAVLRRKRRNGKLDHFLPLIGFEIVIQEEIVKHGMTKSLISCENYLEKK